VVLLAVVAVYDQLAKPHIERFAHCQAGRALAAGRKAWAVGVWAPAADRDTMLEAAQMLGSPRSSLASPASPRQWCASRPDACVDADSAELEPCGAPRMFDETEHVAPQLPPQSPLPSRVAPMWQ